MSEYNIISLNDINAQNADIGGGKFAGLCTIKESIPLYNAQYGMNFVIPDTYVIPITYFDAYKETGRVPDDLINTAMVYAKKLGGNVAVRSSADVEDKDGKTYSGQFESVLNVKTREQMTVALNTVYASAAKVPNAKMGIILQPMVPTPKMAGVAYSETWYKAPSIVLNYTENDYADKILSGHTSLYRFATGKPVLDKNDNIYELNLSHINNPEYNLMFYKHNQFKAATKQERKQYKNHFLISGLCSQLEQDLGYPIDMEFVVSDDGTINIVQQRPYRLPEFYVLKIDAHTTSVFSPEKPIIAGSVGFVDSLHPWRANKDFDINIWKAYDCVYVFTKDSVGVKIKFEFDWHNSPFEAEYTHYGNMSREGSDFTVLETHGREDEFKKINQGDYMIVNMLTGKFCIIPKER
ncbi:MAG: hypothetical protein J6T57_04155 [Alphaproteobacteria bacterium]|nr:hypothetical protein [Alphaproteobacteria bacterium]